MPLPIALTLFWYAIWASAIEEAMAEHRRLFRVPCSSPCEREDDPEFCICLRNKRAV